MKFVSLLIVLGAGFLIYNAVMHALDPLGMKNHGLIAVASVARADDAAANGPLTFSRDVAPIFYKNCIGCHRPGEIGPMSLTDYASARPYAKSIKKAITEKAMPPWDADSSLMKYANDRSLSEKDIATIVKWIDTGAIEGNKAEMPALPKFNDTWAMGEPDFIFETKRDFDVPANNNEIEYQNIVFNTNITEDLYISEWEIRPTERATVHHANLVRSPLPLDDARAGGLVATAVMKGGDYVGSYLPGARPFKYPDGMALRIPKGSSLAIQTHYVGLDKPVKDHMRFGVKFAKGRIDKLVRVVGTDDSNRIQIPPNDPNYSLVGEVTFLYDSILMSSGVHMHLRGKSMTMEAILPDGTKKLVTSIPHYKFNWQSNYQLAEPVFVPKGTKLHVTSVWDNSKGNPNNPNPNVLVKNGPWTQDEMINSWTHVVLADEKLGLKIADGKMVGKFPDAQEKPHPILIQTLPGGGGFKPPANPAPAPSAGGQ